MQSFKNLAVVCRPAGLQDAHTVASISQLQQQIAHGVAEHSIDKLHERIHWLQPSQLRIPLLELGCLSDDEQARACRLLAQLAGQLAPVDVHFRQVGALPSWRKPRTVWIGPKSTDERRPLRQLQAKLAAAFAPPKRGAGANRVVQLASTSPDFDRQYHPSMPVGIFQELYTPSLKRSGFELRVLATHEYAVDFSLRIDALHLVDVARTQTGATDDRLIEAFPLTQVTPSITASSSHFQ